MENNTTLTLNEAGSLLLGAGLVQVGTDINIGLILVGIGTAMKVGVALLNKFGIPITGRK